MKNASMTDAECIEEVGRILCQGALRAMGRIDQISQDKELDDCQKAGITVRDGEKFAVRKSSPDAKPRTSRN